MEIDAFALLVEFPRGSHGLRSQEPFPVHAGHLPRTLGRDGAPLGAFAVTAGAAAPGERLEVRAVGLLLAGRDQWVVCAAAEDRAVRSPDDLPAALRAEIERFVATPAPRWCDQEAAIAAVIGGRATWTAATEGE